MVRSAWFRTANAAPDDAPGRVKSWQSVSDEQRQELMRERFKGIVDKNKEEKNRFQTSLPSNTKEVPSRHYAFFDRIHGAKMQSTIDQLAKEVASANKPIREVFAEFDLDGDGTLDREEMKIGMANFGVSAKMWELDAVMRLFDDDGNGSIDYEEFAEMLERHAEESEAPPDKKSGFLKRSGTAIAEMFSGPGKSKPKSKGLGPSPAGPAGQRGGPAPPRVESGSRLAPVKEVRIQTTPPGTPDGGRGVPRNGSKALLAAGGLQMRHNGGSDLQLNKQHLPPMVRQEAIKGIDDLEWLQTIMDSIQRPKLRRALDKLAGQMSDARYTALNVFKEMDLNGDHLLSKDEINTGLRKLKVSLVPAELDAIMFLFDEDDNGGVDYREFSTLLARYSRLISPLPPHVRADAIRTTNDMHWIETVLVRIHSPKLRATLDRLAHEIYGSTRSMHSFFIQFDLNGDGVLNPEEMHAGLSKMAGPLELTEVEGLMLAFDADGNGEIDYKEFCSMLARYGRLTMPSESQKTQKNIPADEPAEDFPVGCKVMALFNLPKATSAEDKIGTVMGAGKKGTLLVKFRRHEPMVVRNIQVRRVDGAGVDG